jgi:cyclic-di-GMP phosphodiesterase TipF (flagellum assembly factor)
MRRGLKNRGMKRPSGDSQNASIDASSAGKSESPVERHSSEAIGRMGPHGILHVAAGATGAAAAGAATWGLGAPVFAIGLTALFGGMGVASFATAWMAGRARAAAEARFDTLAQEMVLIRQRQIDFEAKFVDVERRASESPALIWRAATSDIQVLGSLVSDLARTVAEHDAKLAVGLTLPAEQAAIGADAPVVVLPATSPPPASWFEDEAELGFTADAGAVPSPPRAAKAAVLAELKSTLATALASDRMELCLQPYVTLPQRKIAGYEATLSLRSESGEMQSAEELRAAARAAGMATEMDRLLIERAGQVLRVLRARDRIVAVTCAIEGSSLLDANFRSSVEMVARAEGKLAQNILLSVPLADAARLKAEGEAALDSLRRTGVALGVHATAAAGIDAAGLEKIGVREARLPAAALVGGGTAEGADIHPADISELLERRGIRLLVTGVDGEATVRDLLDCSAALAQGALFGPSRPVRPEVLQPRAVQEPGAPSRTRTAPPTEADQPRRQSFRSMLRRA